MKEAKDGEVGKIQLLFLTLDLFVWAAWAGSLGLSGQRGARKKVVVSTCMFTLTPQPSFAPLPHSILPWKEVSGGSAGDHSACIPESTAFSFLCSKCAQIMKTVVCRPHLFEYKIS